MNTTDDNIIIPSEGVLTITQGIKGSQSSQRNYSDDSCVECEEPLEYRIKPLEN